MTRPIPLAALALVLAVPIVAHADEPAATPPPVSFLKDLAPVLVQNCIACHNPKQSQGKYVMTTFAQLAKGGKAGQGINLVGGDPDASYLVELCRVDGEPRMPYKMDPLPAPTIALIERWVREGAKYDGADPAEDWLVALRKATPTVVPDAYPVPVPITALAFRPDGAAVLASGYHELTTWGTADGALRGRTGGLAERTHDVAISPDGAFLATAGGDPGRYGSVRLFAVGTDGALPPARELPESIDSVFAVAFSPDGTKLAAAGADRAVRIWEVATGKELLAIEDHADWVLDIAWSPDGRRIATASRDKTAKVFDAEKKEVLATFPGHAETVTCVTFAADGKSVVTGGHDNRLRVWNPDDDAKQIRTVDGFGGPIFRLALAPDGRTLAATGADKVVRVFEDFNPRHALSGHNDWVYSLAFGPDGKTLASGCYDGEVRLWSLPDGKPVRQFLAAPGLAGSKP